MSEGRTIKSLRNVIYGVLGQVLTYGCNFLVRTVLIRTLTVEYWGVSGLFSTVLTLLSLSELGVGTAILFHLYKPMAQGDQDKVCALMDLYRRAYRWIGLVVAGIGVLLIPFLPYLIKGGEGIEHLTWIYLLFLFQSVTSYLFFAYKSAIFEANQQKYLVVTAGYWFTILSCVGQIALLVLTHNYIATLLVQIGCNIAKNLYVAYRADRAFPYLKEPVTEKLTREELTEIGRNVYGLAMNKVAGVALNATDSLVISAYLGLTAVGIYSNYQMIFQACLMVVSTIFSSLTASIGNLNATETPEKKYQVFRRISFANYFFYGGISTVLWVILNDFVEIWTGDRAFIYPMWVTGILILNFLTSGLLSAVTSFRDACGLYWQGRYRMLIYGLLNVIFSILLVRPLGAGGVFLATILGRMLIVFTYDPWLVFWHVFQCSPKAFYGKFLQHLCVTVLAAAFGRFCCQWIAMDTLWGVILGACVSGIVFLFITVLCFLRSEELAYYWDIVLRILRGNRRERSK